MAQLNELKMRDMDYPYGKCHKCGCEFTEELRNRFTTRYCPECGALLDDHLTPCSIDERETRLRDLYCDSCGHRIYARHGKGGTWIDPNAGVCGDGCGRELCGQCGDWDEDTGLCVDCTSTPGFAENYQRLHADIS